MSNVWTLIALRVPCAASPAQRQPVLQLFNGFRRKIHIQSASRQHCAHWTNTGKRVERRLNFSTSTAFAARVKGNSQHTPKINTKILHRGKVQIPKSVASHTEGLPESAREDADGISWRDYDPLGGMPLPEGELTHEEVARIFNDGSMDIELGNYILSVIHWRRISGALIDVGLGFPRGSDVKQEQALLALEYLREKMPDVDEQANGERWAEEETERLRKELQERAVNIGLYKRNEPVEVEEPEEEQQGTEWGRERSGESALERIRKEKEAAWEEEQARRAAQEQRERLATLHSARGPLELSGGVQPSVALTTTDADNISISRPQTKAWLAPVVRRPWVKYYEEQATLIKENAVPKLRTAQRIVPPFLVMFLTVALCIYASSNYTPPPTSARMFPDTPSSVATIGALTALLCTTFVLSRIPFFWRANSKYFAITPAYPNALSVLGAIFRHDTVAHLARNLIPLWFLGLTLHEDVGRGTFLAIFFGAGVIGGYGSLLYNVATKQWTTYIFGSSGSILGVIGAVFTLHPNGPLYLFGYEVPIATWLLLAAFGASEVYATIRMKKTTNDHVGHIGGIISGVAAGLWLKNKAAREQEEREKRLAAQPIAVHTPFAS